MQSDDQSIRNAVTNEIRRVHPLFAAGVETGKAMEAYTTDFHTRSLKQMRNYQEKHRVVFCKACPKREKYGRRIYRRLHISFEADLLGNIERVVHAECFKCGFDMMLPAEREDYITSKVDEFEWNRVRGAFNELHLERDVPLEMIFHSLQQCAQEYELKYNRRNMTASEVAYRQREMEERMRQVQAAPALPERSRGREDHAVDALRYMMVNNPDMFDSETFKDLLDNAALSSAPKIQVKGPKK